MIQRISAEEYLRTYKNIPLIDVRSPAEHEHAHHPGAISIPLFSNEERALIGTLYKHQGKSAAIEAGITIVSPHLQQFIDKLKEATAQKNVAVYCWRGGMRSQSLAMLFAIAGYKTFQIIGGYKALKKMLREAVAEKKNAFILLGGKTGSGKTDLLKELQNNSEQVINLEGIARHKGSTYGGLGNREQPSQEQFSVTLFHQLYYMDPKKVIWLEHEGSRLGDIQIPPELSTLTSTAPVLYITIPLQERVTRIINEYGSHTRQALIACTKKLEQQLGGKATTDICALIEQQNIEAAVQALLEHYDRTYTFSKQRNKTNQFIDLDLQNTSSEKRIRKLIDTAEQYKNPI